MQESFESSLQPVSADKNRATYNKLGVRLLLNFRVPVSKGTNKGGQLSSEIYSFRGVAAGTATYEKLGLDPSANIVLHYDRSRLFIRVPSSLFRGRHLRA